MALDLAGIVDWISQGSYGSSASSAYVASAGNGASQIAANYLMKQCVEIPNNDLPFNSQSAERAFNPLDDLVIYRGETGRSKRGDVSVSQKPSHGRISLETASDGRQYFRYDPYPSFLGRDVAVFDLSYSGNRYRVVVTFIVTEVVNDNDSACPKRVEIKRVTYIGEPFFDSQSVSIGFADSGSAFLGFHLIENGDAIVLNQSGGGWRWFVVEAL
ncbi:hypothetical protein [Niveibacterium sp.]|uniref:hypothetical protein n=1 Tax=Niveibacterium sp. TaxID=2017444 RepID=UPI0035B3F4FB